MPAIAPRGRGAGGARRATMNEKRDNALSELLRVEDDVVMFDVRSIADIQIVVDMARHQIKETIIHEDFLELLLTHVERLVLRRTE